MLAPAVCTAQLVVPLEPLLVLAASISPGFQPSLCPGLPADPAVHGRYLWNPSLHNNCSRRFRWRFPLVPLIFASAFCCGSASLNQNCSLSGVVWNQKRSFTDACDWLARNVYRGIRDLYKVLWFVNLIQKQHIRSFLTQHGLACRLTARSSCTHPLQVWVSACR